MKSSNDSFNSHVEWLGRERVFHRYCAPLLAFLQASTPCSVKRDNTALSQPWPNCHTLYPGHPMASWTKAIVPNESSEQQMNWAWNKRHRQRGILKAFFFFEKIENFSCLHLDQCLCLCWAVQRQTIRCNFILLHQLLHIPSQTAPLSRRFVRAPQWRDADRLSCLNGFSRAAERPAQQ